MYKVVKNVKLGDRLVNSGIAAGTAYPVDEYGGVRVSLTNGGHVDLADEGVIEVEDD